MNGPQNTTLSNDISLPRGLDPLDFSFKCLCSLNDLKEEVPRPRDGKHVKSKKVVETVLKERPDNFFDELATSSSKEEDSSNNNRESVDNEFTGLLSKPRGSTDSNSETEQITHTTYVSTAIRLNNNTLSDLADLQPVMSSILVNWQWLAWIDLSFNDISVIDVCFSSFPELRLIYLHGNAIEKIAEIDKLKNVQHLHTLTLHGNPIEMSENYRFHVLKKLPHLKTLDFSAVTKQEKRLCHIRKYTVKKT
jgi:hypothetical protein